MFWVRSSSIRWLKLSGLLEIALLRIRSNTVRTVGWVVRHVSKERYYLRDLVGSFTFDRKHALVFSYAEAALIQARAHNSPHVCRAYRLTRRVPVERRECTYEEGLIFSMVRTNPGIRISEVSRYNVGLRSVCQNMIVSGVLHLSPDMGLRVE